MQSHSDKTALRPVALIIGGSGGIGRKIATQYLSAGWRVVITGFRSAQLEAVHRELQQISAECFAFQCDIADTNSVETMAQQVLSLHGCPDVLVNCAGYAVYLTVQDTAWDELDNLMQVNFIGVMRCVKAFLPAMIARKSGSIVNVSSVAGRLVITPCGTYSAAKHALVAWSQILRYELARFGIHVLVVCPGRVETGFFEHETFQTRVARAETRYVISAEQVATATVDAVKRNRFMTYVPRTFALAAWLMDVFPWTKWLYDKLIFSRIETYYSTRKQGDDEPAT